MNPTRKQLVDSLLAPWLGNHLEQPVEINCQAQHRVIILKPLAPAQFLGGIRLAMVTTTGFGSARYYHHIDYQAGTCTSERRPNVRTVTQYLPCDTDLHYTGPTVNQIIQSLLDYDFFVSGLRLNFGDGQIKTWRLSAIERLNLEQVRLHWTVPCLSDREPIWHTSIHHPATGTGWLEDD